MNNLKPQKKLEALVGKVVKTSYKNLTLEERKIIRLMKNIYHLHKGMKAFYKNAIESKEVMTSEEVLDDWNFICQIEKRQKANIRKMFFLKEKNGWSNEDVSEITERHIRNNIYDG